jgi:hypothetical protein
MEEETRHDGLADEGVVFATAFYLETVFLQEIDELFADIFRPAHTPLLYKILLGPGCRVSLALPSFEHLQVGEMVSFEVVELGFLLVGERFFIFRAVEYILD